MHYTHVTTALPQRYRLPWSEFEPNNFKEEENCISLGVATGRRVNGIAPWNDVRCDKPKRPFVCKRTCVYQLCSTILGDLLCHDGKNLQIFMQTNAFSLRNRKHANTQHARRALAHTHAQVL